MHFANNGQLESIFEWSDASKLARSFPSKELAISAGITLRVLMKECFICSFGKAGTGSPKCCLIKRLNKYTFLNSANDHTIGLMLMGH